MEKYRNTRPCITKYNRENPVTALFHGWSHVAEVAAPSPLIGGHGGGQLAATFALLEYEDGTVGEVPVNSIIFLDSAESFAVYDWKALGDAALDREKRRAQHEHG